MMSNQGAREDEGGAKQSRLARYAQFKREAQKNRGRWIGVCAVAVVAMFVVMSGWR